MRLQLTAVILLCMLPVNALADHRAESWLAVYVDDDRLTVISPQLNVLADVHDDLAVMASYDVDVISAATIDVTTAASPRGYKERRHSVGVGALWRLGSNITASLRYLPSWEPDYQSQSMAVGVSKEFANRRLTLSTDVRLNFDQVGRSGDSSELWHSVTTTSVGGNASIVINPRTVGHLAYELQVRRGYQASPYRYVTIRWDDGSSAIVPEVVPDSRDRHALAIGLRHALLDSWYLSAQYRLYLDTWGILSHTGTVQINKTLRSNQFTIGASIRGYQQGLAEFQQQRYESAVGMLPQYRSADKSLAQSYSVLVGGRFEASLGSAGAVEAMRAILKVEVYDQHFVDFDPMTRRIATIGSAGLSAEF